MTERVGEKKRFIRQRKINLIKFLLNFNLIHSLSLFRTQKFYFISIYIYEKIIKRTHRFSTLYFFLYYFLLADKYRGKKRGKFKFRS